MSFLTFAPTMRTPEPLKSLGRFLILNAIIGGAVTLFFTMHGDTSAKVIFYNFSYSFIMSCAMSFGIGSLIRLTQKRLDWLKSPVKRFFFDLFAITTYAFAVSALVYYIFGAFVFGFIDPRNVSAALIAPNTIVPTMVALVVSMFFTAKAFLEQWKAAALEAEQMRNERLKGQYQSLKDQLNPHFLFNSLNVLSNLVYEDADKANAFIEKLSRVYRYVLEVQEEELVPLSRELDFARSYLELQELRFGGKFGYSIAVQDAESVWLPPLSLQLLLENALKHNSATREAPLQIDIVREVDDLLVSNNVQKRSAEGPPSGIGLRNIKARYGFLSESEVVVTPGPAHFAVRLPLLPSPKSEKP